MTRCLNPIDKLNRFQIEAIIALHNNEGVIRRAAAECHIGYSAFYLDILRIRDWIGIDPRSAEGLDKLMDLIIQKRKEIASAGNREERRRNGGQD